MDKNNNTNPITDFSLTELLALSGEEHNGLMSECIATESESQLEAFRFPCRIDAFIIGIGIEGETMLSYNLHKCHLKKNTLFLFAPNTIIQVHAYGAFKGHIVAISSEFIRHLNIDLKSMIPLLMRFSEHPCFELTDQKLINSMSEFIALIRNEIHSPESQFSKEVVSGLLTTLLYKVCDIIYNYISKLPESNNTVRDRTENYFRRFMQLLGEHYRRERSVSFYARQLCITPKYLTTLIKRISGQSVSEWIDSYVILEAKTLLKHSHMSIQEIAYYLNFPNQSFFGSYFKRNTGMSPTQYKEQQ